MARVTLPASRLKARRRTKRVRLLLLGLLFVVLIAAGTIALAYAPFLRIKNISIQGTESISAAVLETFVHNELDSYFGYVLPKDNIFIYPKVLLRENMLKRFPVIQSADVHAENFSTLAVEISERKPHALWCGTSRKAEMPCVLLDDSGVAYGNAVSFSGSVYVRYYGEVTDIARAKQYLSEDTFHALDALVFAIAEKIEGDSLMYVEVDTQQDVRAGWKSGFELLFPLKEDGAAVIERFTLARTAEPFKDRTLSDFLYLDLRFGDKLYYKLK